MQREAAGRLDGEKKKKNSFPIHLSPSCRLSQASVSPQHLLLHFTLVLFYSHALLTNEPQQHKTAASSHSSTG